MQTLNSNEPKILFLEEYGIGIWKQESLIGLELKRTYMRRHTQKSQFVKKKDKAQIKEKGKERQRPEEKERVCHNKYY